jgi:hypothetical protein
MRGIYPENDAVEIGIMSRVFHVKKETVKSYTNPYKSASYDSMIWR